MLGDCRWTRCLGFPRFPPRSRRMDAGRDLLRRHRWREHRLEVGFEHGCICKSSHRRASDACERLRVQGRPCKGRGWPPGALSLGVVCVSRNPAGVRRRHRIKAGDSTYCLCFGERLSIMSMLQPRSKRLHYDELALGRSCG